MFFQNSPPWPVCLGWPYRKCESWTIKKAEHIRINAFELWCWRRLLRVPWTARRSNQFILREISPECLLDRLMLKLKLQYFGHLMEECELTSCGNTNLRLTAEQPSIGECRIPPKNDTLNPGVKEKPQQDGMMGEILFRLKPYTCQRCTEGPSKPCGHQDPGKGAVTHKRDWTRPAFECLSVSCRGRLKRPWGWERLKVRGEGDDKGWEGDDKGWDGWMASPPHWTWVWVISGSWWWTGRPDVLQSMGLQRLRHDWVTEVKWTEWGMAHSFIESDRAVIYMSSLANFLWLWFSFCLPSDG